jgi:hypothetical protein
MQGWWADRARLDSSKDAHNDFFPGWMKPSRLIDDGWVALDLIPHL